MRRKSFHHVIAIIGIAIFAFAALGSNTSKPAVTSEPVAYTPPPSADSFSSITTPKGTPKSEFHDMVGPSERPFDVLGLVFATSVTEIDEKGQRVDNQESIGTLLLRQAQLLGGNDILNVRVDENVTKSTQQTTTGNTTRLVTTTRIIYTGSALAIRYR